MIIYSKTLWGFPLLTRVYGSALPRSFLPALLSGMITLLLLLLREHMQHLWVHPYPYQPLVLIATFVLTFRSNYAYQRHWEAYTQMQTMTARWLDATVQAIMFDRHPQPPGGKLPSPASHHQFVAELVHLVSLMHATCCAALRRDPDVSNLVRHSRLAQAPPTDPAQLNLQRSSVQSASNSPRGASNAAGSGRRASVDGLGGGGGGYNGSVSPRVQRRRSAESSGSIFGAISPRASRRRSAEASPFAAAAVNNNNFDGGSSSSAAAAAAAGGEKSSATGFAAAAEGGGGSSSGRWSAAFSSALPFHRHGEYSIVGAANWRDIFMLRGSPQAVSEYNAAQPLPVVGGVTKQELAALGCKLRQQQQQQDEAAGIAGQVLESVDEDGVYNRQQQQQYVQRSGISAADTAAVRDSGQGGKAFWGMLRHRSGSQQQQQQQPGHARSLSFSEGVAVGDSTQQQQQQQRHALGPRPISDNSAHAYNGHNSNSSSSGNGLKLKPLVQLSGYFDIAALSSKLQSARSFGWSPSVPSFPSVTSPTAASGLNRTASTTNLKLNVMPRRFKVSLNHTCCWAHLPYMDRPLLLLSWVHELMLQRQTAGGLRMPAPILARVYTGLSDGLTAYEQCRKLADTPFPFPWAQFVLVMLVLFTVTLPLLVVAYVNDNGMAVVITVMTTSIFWTVNEVARDVEDAFIMEPNNMPLANTQYHFNELLLTLSVAERPASGVVPVVLPMPPGMRLPGSIRAVGTAGDLAAAASAAAAAVAEGASLHVDTTRPPGPTVLAAAAATAAAAAGPGVQNGFEAAAEKFGVPVPAAAAAASPTAAATAFDAPYGHCDETPDASPRSSGRAGHSRNQSDNGAGLQHHQLQQHQDQQAELLLQPQDHHQQQQQQQQQHFESQGLKPLVVRRSFTGSSASSTGHGTPRFASDPGVQPAAAAAAAGSAACSAAPDGQYSLIAGQYNAELYSTEQQQQQYNTWDDDVSRTAMDACSISAGAAADLELTGTAAARAALVASAASNIQSMEAFAAVANSSAAVEDAAAGVSGWEQQQPASVATSSVGTGSDDMV